MNTKILRNLVILMVYPGLFNGKDELRLEWDAAIEVQRGLMPQLSGNAVAGSERAAYRLDGEPCSATSQVLATNWAHSALIGVLLLPLPDGDGLPG